MGIFSGYKYVNSKGEKFWLHKTEGRGGVTLYFFSREEFGSVDKPEGWKVVENKRTGLPVLKKIRPETV
jgi:hypothetical protein